jgi:DNA-3-methyladenine glycosylase II
VTPSLDEVTLRRAVRILARRDPELAAIARQYGPPPLWAREPGFATLVHMILEQQVSLASARAVFERLRAALPAFEPASFLALDDSALKVVGITRQKTRYARELAHAIASDTLDLHGLGSLDDASVHATLTRVKGIGLWTSNVYLLMALGRPDAFPASDIALITAAHRVKRLRRRPTPERLERMAENWRPWRAVAARLLWHFYLSEKAGRGEKRRARNAES